MAAEFNVSVTAELTGLGEDTTLIDKGADGTTPTAYTKQYRTIGTTDVAEALDLGDVSTVTCVIIKAISKNLDIDCDYVSAFDADLQIKEGAIPAVIPNPAGTIYVKNHTALEVPVYEYIVIGTT